MGRDDLCSYYEEELEDSNRGIIPWDFLVDDIINDDDDEDDFDQESQFYSSRYHSVLNWFIYDDYYKFDIDELVILYAMAKSVLEQRKEFIARHQGEKRNKGHIRVKDKWRRIRNILYDCLYTLL